MAYYFISDVHLGTVTVSNPKELEARLVSCLDAISDDVTELFLVGDIFDFWYEYKRVVPKGFVRTLSRLAAMTDRGIKVHFFTGNHDIWAFSYLKDECGVELHFKPEIFELGTKRVYVGHGDGLGNRDIWYKIINAVFKSRFTQWLFTNFVHPDLALKFGHWWSSGSRKGKPAIYEFSGEKSWIVEPMRAIAEANELDYCVIGHLHSSVKFQLTDRCELVILGEWIERPSYGVLNDNGFEIIKLK